MSSELVAALIGAVVGGTFALLGAVLQHILSLREERIRREYEAQQKLRSNLLTKDDHTVNAARCPSCNSVHPLESKFCPECGQILER